jgi:hypothetical protein
MTRVHTIQGTEAPIGHDGAVMGIRDEVARRTTAAYSVSGSFAEQL